MEILNTTIKTIYLPMFQLQENFSLKNYNTMGLDVSARFFFEYESLDELVELLKSGKAKEHPCLVMGGGSNLLFVSDFNGLVLHSGISDIDVVDESSDEVIVAAGAGVLWDHLVAWSIENGLGGLENLSLIPGTVGAAPVQNIGAYGVELKDVFYRAEGVYLASGESFAIAPHACEFGYRYSVFKGALKNQVVLTRVFFRLSRKPVFKIEYGSVKEELAMLGETSLTNIRKAIINIRSAKLPDTTEMGNVGSFFKNPVITKQHYNTLKQTYPQMPYYATGQEGLVKIPAGWLIEKSGWKGRSLGRAGVHHQQALVLVNLGGASGQEILELASRIESDIYNQFTIQLEKEVNVITS